MKNIFKYVEWIFFQIKWKFLLEIVLRKISLVFSSEYLNNTLFILDQKYFIY